MYFDTWDMEVGFYYCNLLLLDNFNNEYVIPVELEVEQYVDLTEYKNDEARVLHVFPNPFKNITDIIIDVPYDCKIQLEIIDIQGRSVNELFNSKLSAGTYTIQWNGKTTDNISVESGIYICRYSYGDKVYSTRIVKQ